MMNTRTSTNGQCCTKISEGNVFVYILFCFVIHSGIYRLTLFSIPYYSSNSLLPSDPAPFTMPSAVSLKRAHQPSVSLKEYPLPDGNWCWVSNSWMVDMRSDSGEVQHDGFEYNWIFRTHHWHPQVGPLSAAGWVRRRRWVRLMMRPGKKRRMVTEEGDGMNDGPTPTITSLSLRSSWNGWDKRLSTTPSLFTNTTSQRDTFYLPEVWQGNVDEDWVCFPMSYVQIYFHACCSSCVESS